MEGISEEVMKWLADAPLFIDAVQVDRFFDAVVNPANRVTAITLSAEEDKAHEHGAEAKGEISGAVPFIAKGKVSIGANTQITTNTGKSKTIAYELITTPERQLRKIVEHYKTNYKDRIFYVDDAAEDKWRASTTILNSPRVVIFMDLPGEGEAKLNSKPSVKLIPTAAEFENGKIIPIFRELRAKSGENLPDYPEKDTNDKTVSQLRKEYWAWFDSNFSATSAMLAVEKAASENGRIRWIDYRLPITNEGDTLHLHLQPKGDFDTGVFAYNFIKRGFKHGLRLIGTLKAEPDMNVLAIYEK